MDILQVPWMNRVSAMRYAGISFAENTMDNAVCKTLKKIKSMQMNKSQQQSPWSAILNN